ncbi:LCP family protein required for cell wall assembly [Kitasatospora gansuensis]|uniref:LCP family protein required for cell wall assembly n=1 Tax=Kitasatospora gansuensis TaxID=258050 RepID=A0A7W7SEB3_9ACTN|nr:LCP family protein [Kitasatospora gansuensis]MBB4948925.1 LCP family protein required for cell wall assembly [Kitasatospora gansuensis]
MSSTGRSGGTPGTYGSEPPLPPSLDPRGGPAVKPPGRRRNWWRVTRWTVGLLVLALVGTAVGSYVWADAKIRHVDAIADWSGRPGDGPGTNWLLVGSDSRAGLTEQQERDLHVGGESGINTDTIMVLHRGDNGPVLMSIPRDSYVAIPGHGKNKINAAFAQGGPQLLVQTVEQNTGIRIDHYVEVGFTGIVSIVDSLGGVSMCLDQPVVDSKSGADLPAGCQTLNGTQALALVRTRYSLPNSDLSRIGNQQAFLQALAKEVLSPSTLLNPFVLYPFLSAALGALTVDQASSLWTLAQFGLQMDKVAGAGGRTVTVPIADEDYRTPAGSSILWAPNASKELFEQIQNDRPVPAPS